MLFIGAIFIKMHHQMTTNFHIKGFILRVTHQTYLFIAKTNLI